MTTVRCPWGTRGSADCRQYGSPKCSGKVCGCDVVGLVASGTARFVDDRDRLAIDPEVAPQTAKAIARFDERAKHVAPSRHRFTFPPTKWSTIPATVASSLIQHRAIVAEVEEVQLAIIDPLGTSHHICVELMDIQAAVETELRKQQRAGVDLDAVYDEVLEKNDRRSYWIGEVGV